MDRGTAEIIMSHGAKNSTGNSKKSNKPGEHEPIDFLATGFQVTTNCAASVRILENFKLRSDHLLSGCTQSPSGYAQPCENAALPGRISEFNVRSSEGMLAQ